MKPVTNRIRLKIKGDPPGLGTHHGTRKGSERGPTIIFPISAFAAFESVGGAGIAAR